MRAVTGAAPEETHLPECREDPGRDALSLGVSRPEQEQHAGWLKMADERAHPVDPVGRHESLADEDFAQLVVEVVGERRIVCLFDRDAAFLGLADATPAGAGHIREDGVFTRSEVDLEGAVVVPHVATPAKTEPVRLLRGEPPVS